jgi:hypothetical protein
MLASFSTTDLVRGYYDAIRLNSNGLSLITAELIRRGLRTVPTLYALNRMVDELRKRGLERLIP